MTYQYALHDLNTDSEKPLVFAGMMTMHEHKDTLCPVFISLIVLCCSATRFFFSGGEGAIAPPLGQKAEGNLDNLIIIISVLTRTCII